MLKSNSDLERQSLEQHDLLVESRRRLDVRDRIDERRGLAQGQVRRERLERATRFESESKGEMSGNAALGASALIQAALGVELTLSSLNKLADPQYVANFTAFVRSSPGALSGILSPLVQTLVLPHGAIFARLVEVTELLLGVILLIGAAEIGRRRFAGRVGAQHGYEAPVALVSALAGLAAAGLTLSVGILMGEGFPTVTPGRAFTSAIPVELLIVPLGVAIAWLEFGRFLALRRSSWVRPRRAESRTAMRTATSR